MSKELKALERIKGIADRIEFNQKNKLGDVGYQWVKEVILDNIDDIETALKALEIIKEKRVDVDLFYTVMEDENQVDKLASNNFWADDECKLTKEEFDLLKKVLL